MTAAVIALCVLLWEAVGVAGFVYWWTADDDLTSTEIPLAAFAAIAGPAAWFIGRTIHGDHSNPPRVWKKQRS